VFAQRGYHDARIQDIAEHARIAVGTVYNHFEQKEDVLRALLEERMEGFTDQFLPLPGEPDAFADKLKARVSRMLTYVQQHRDFYVVAIEHGLLFKGSIAAGSVLGKPLRTIERFRATLRALMEEGITRGALREGTDPVRLAWCFGGLTRTFTLCALEQGVTNLEAEASLIVDLFLNGAGARPPR